MNELIAFLTARIDDDEAVATAAGGEWDARTLGGALGPGITAGHGIFLRDAQPTGRLATTNTRPLADHIALHDPARVLREVEADRKLLAAYMRAARVQPVDSWESDYTQALGDALAFRAAVWSDHPGYRAEWKPRA